VLQQFNAVDNASAKKADDPSKPKEALPAKSKQKAHANDPKSTGPKSDRGGCLVEVPLAVDSSIADSSKKEKG
jgi:hypothetical protein